MTSKRATAGFALAGGLILAASTAAVRGDGAPMAGATDWPMWGGTPSRNMVSAANGLPDKWDVKTKSNVRWVADLGSQTYGNATVVGRQDLRRHQQRAAARQAADRRPRRADGVQAGHRRVPVADHPREGRRRPRQRLAVPGHRQLAARRGRQDLLRQQPRRGDVPRHRGLPRQQRERRPGHRREVQDAERRRRRLEVRHDGGGRRLPAQPVELVAGRPWRPDLRDDVERAGREPRQHPVPEGAGNHRPQQDHRQAGLGRQLGVRQDPARPVVVAVGRHHRRRRSRSSTPRATAGSAATRRLPARSCGSSTRTRRTRCGRRRATR